MQFTDSHCHLDFPEISSNISTLLNHCRQQNIHKVIVPSVSPDNWQSVLDLAVLSTPLLSISTALGIHPWYLNNLEESSLDALSTMVDKHQSTICAIGETGIDGKIAEEQNNLTKQQMFFEYQLQLAKQQKLPVIVHHRKSHQHIIPLLKKSGLEQTGIIHGFSGSYQQASAYLDLGFKLGIGGTISYERAKKTINTVKKLPLSAIVLETDAPAMPLHGYQGQPNSPLRLINVFNILTNIRTETPQIIAEQIEKNCRDIFGE